MSQQDGQNSVTPVISSLCEWVLLCEFTRGIIEAGVVAPEQVLDVLSTCAPSEQARGWAAYLLQPSVPFSALSTLLSEPVQLKTDKYYQGTLLAELLLGRRYTHAAFLSPIAKLIDLRSAFDLFTQIRDAMESCNNQQIEETLDAVLPKLLVKNRVYCFSVAQTILRRIYSWPLFYIRRGPVHSSERTMSLNGRMFAGLSLPLMISVDHNSAEQPQSRITLGEETQSFPLHRYGINTKASYCSILRAVQAAQDAWRSQHGRVILEYRNILSDCCFDFNFSPTVRAIKLLSQSGYPDLVPLGEQFELALQKPQRSMEAYVAQAVMSRVLDRRFGSRTSATGCLVSPTEQRRRLAQRGAPQTNRPSWLVAWPDHADAYFLVQGILGKALHAGKVGTYERLVVPHDGRINKRLQEERIQIGKDSYMPNLIPVSSLTRLLDVAIAGLWRTQRYVRCDHLALLSSALNAQSQQRGPLGRVEQYLLTQLTNLAPIEHSLASSIQQSRRSCLLIRTDNPELVVRALVGLLAKLNDLYLVGRNAPTKLSYLIFRAVEHEVGLAFLATLFNALSGQLDGRALSLIQELGTTFDAAPAFANWFNHRYSELEPWQGPDLTVIYGLDTIRQHSKRRVFGSETWFDPLSLLLDLHRYLGEVIDIRHQNFIGLTRMILIDTFEHADEIAPLVANDWDVLTITTGQSEIPTPSWTRSSAAATALSVLRTAAPVPVFLSVRRHINRSSLYSDTSLLSEMFHEIRDGQVINQNGLLSLLPESTEYHRRVLSANLFSVHWAAARSYAPWLNSPGGGALVPSTPTSPDHWLHPELLSEAYYHLSEAASLVSHERNRPLSSMVRGAIPRMVVMQHHTPPARLRILRRNKVDLTSFLEWERIVSEELPVNIAERFQVLSIGAFLLFEKWEILKLSPDELEKKVQNILAALGKLENSMRSLSRSWAKAIQLLIVAHLDCVTGNPVDSDFRLRLEMQVKRCVEKGMTLNDAASVFEALGDLSVSELDDDNARKWYSIGLSACSRHRLFCQVKFNALNSSLHLVSEKDRSRASRRFARSMSPVSRLSEPVSARLGHLLLEVENTSALDEVQDAEISFSLVESTLNPH
ncbi:MAG: hypothetical protein JNM40_18385 [Myxococcales bacterium]|nr:hypothetical protein [Myxococcales bacterium]